MHLSFPYYVWVEPGYTGELPSSFSSIGKSDHDKLVALRSELASSDYLAKEREGFWKKELSERASRIQDIFRGLVAERGLIY